MSMPEIISFHAATADGGPEPAAAGRELAQCLADLQGLLKQLAELARRKLDALRQADADALQTCSAREAALLEQLAPVERRRDAVLARLAQALRRPELPRAGLSEIAVCFPEPVSSHLRARNAALREITTVLREKNQMAARVARELHQHIRGVFDEVTRAAQESVVYGSQGQWRPTPARSWVDAVG